MDFLAFFVFQFIILYPFGSRNAYIFLRWWRVCVCVLRLIVKDLSHWFGCSETVYESGGANKKVFVAFIKYCLTQLCMEFLTNKTLATRVWAPPREEEKTGFWVLLNVVQNTTYTYLCFLCTIPTIFLFFSVYRL